MVLEKIHKENDIKNLSPEELTMLADEIRQFDDALISMHWIPNSYALVKNNCKNTKIEQEIFGRKKYGI